MNCKTVQGLLPRYQDADVTADEATGIDAHIETCETCATELAQLDSTMAFIAGLPDADPPAGFTQNVLAALAAEVAVEPAQEREGPLVGVWLGLVGVAVSVLGMVTLAVAWPASLVSIAMPALRTLAGSVGVAIDVAADLLDALLLATHTHGLWIMAIHLALLLVVHLAWKRLKPADLVKRVGATMIA